MTVRRWIISLFLAFAAVAGLGAQTAADSTETDSLRRLVSRYEQQLSRYERHTQRYRRMWNQAIPGHTAIQVAGSIGAVSAGPGWHYGRGRTRWETELLVGFVPRGASPKAHATLTLRERVAPWSLPLTPGSERWGRLVVEPFTAELAFNFIFGERLWNRWPSRYPKSYYGFPQRMRTLVGFGQRLWLDLPERRRLRHKDIGIYYQLSTCDIYLISAFSNRHVRLRDILSLSLGLTFDYF